MDFVCCFYLLMGKAQRHFFFLLHSHVFFNKLLGLIRKVKFAFLTVEYLHLSVTLFSISAFEGLGLGLGLVCCACDPGSQDFWAHASLIGRKKELCPTL